MSDSTAVPTATGSSTVSVSESSDASAATKLHGATIHAENEENSVAAAAIFKSFKRKKGSKKSKTKRNAKRRKTSVLSDTVSGLGRDSSAAQPSDDTAAVTDHRRHIEDIKMLQKLRGRHAGVDMLRSLHAELPVGDMATKASAVAASSDDVNKLVGASFEEHGEDEAEEDMLEKKL
jgi:hypothetical protein